MNQSLVSRLSVKLPTKPAFTLIEAMIVISMVGFLVVIVMASLSLPRQKAQTSRVRSDLIQTVKAVSLLRADTGKWPNGCEPETISSPVINLNYAQAGLLRRPEVGDQGYGCKWTTEDVANWRGPYIDRLTDVWEHAYFFDPDYMPYQNCEVTTEQPSIPAIVSFGPNGVGPDVYDCDDLFIKVF